MLEVWEKSPFAALMALVSLQEQQTGEITMSLFLKIFVSHARTVVLPAVLFACRGNASGFELMLDPGHSPESPGALSCAGVPEYLYNQKLAEYLIAGMRSSSDIQVKISKSPLDEPELGERVKVTKGLDLFVSLHHDSVQPQFVQRAAEAGKDGNCSRKASGFSIFVSRKNRFFDKSLFAAKCLAKQLLASGLHPSLHHTEAIPGENRPLLDRELGIYAFDELVVLREAQSPALLFEAGVIVNPDDERIVAGDRFRQKVLQALLSSIIMQR